MAECESFEVFGSLIPLGSSGRTADFQYSAIWFLSEMGFGLFVDFSDGDE